MPTRSRPDSGSRWPYSLSMGDPGTARGNAGTGVAYGRLAQNPRARGDGVSSGTRLSSQPNHPPGFRASTPYAGEGRAPGPSPVGEDPLGREGPIPGWVERPMCGLTTQKPPAPTPGQRSSPRNCEPHSLYVSAANATKTHTALAP